MVLIAFPWWSVTLGTCSRVCWHLYVLVREMTRVLCLFFDQIISVCFAVALYEVFT